jgi:hypothetical protein
VALLKDTPFHKLLAASTVVGLVLVWTMQWLGFGMLATGVVGLGGAIVVYVVGGMIFLPDQ